jgi:hypothetical protein
MDAMYTSYLKEIVMGFFSSCDHDWECQNDGYESNGWFGRGKGNTHKCTKCGAVEKCNKDTVVGGYDDRNVGCTKCGEMNPNG